MLLVFITLYIIVSFGVYWYLKIKWEIMQNKWSQQCRISKLLEFQCRRNVVTCQKFCLRSDLHNCDYYLEAKQMVIDVNKWADKKSVGVFRGGVH